MSRVIAVISLFLFLPLVLLQAQETRTAAGVDDVAAQLVVADSEDAVREILSAASEAGLSDVQLAVAFGLTIETLLEEGPRERLPVVMGTFESFVAASSEPADVISAALEAGQDLARSRANAGDPMIATDRDNEPRSPETSLRPSPVGGGSSARGATGGGGGGVVAGGASPS